MDICAVPFTSEVKSTQFKFKQSFFPSFFYEDTLLVCLERVILCNGVVNANIMDFKPTLINYFFVSHKTFIKHLKLLLYRIN